MAYYYYICLLLVMCVLCFFCSVYRVPQLLTFTFYSGKIGQTSLSPLSARSVTSIEDNNLRDFEYHTVKKEGDPSLQIMPSGDRPGQTLRQISEDACGLSFGSHGLTGITPGFLKLSCKYLSNIISVGDMHVVG